MRRIRWFLLPFLVAASALCFVGCARRSAPGPGAPPVAGGPSPTGLTVHFLDIGQGDAALLQWDGHAALVDGGPEDHADALLQDLKRLGVTRLDWVIASHPHADHIGGLIRVFRTMPVAHYLDSGLNTGSPVQVRLLKEIQKQTTTVQIAKAGTTLDLGSNASLKILAPPSPLMKDTSSDPNNNSIVARLDYGATRILFTGDMEGPERAWLFQHAALPDGTDPLRADVLKAAHHGSRNGTNAALLKRVQPRYVTISCELGNSYGHPHKQALQAIRTAPGVDKLFRTDLEGTITLHTDGQTINMTTDHPPTEDIWSIGDRRGTTSRTTGAAGGR
jgi:beta-lactamase superfamily II metal-dependent hydrolase